MQILQAIINGLFMGSLYGLIALGLSLLFGLMKIINFAHGSYLMISMFITYGFSRLTGFNPYLSALVVCPVLFGLGYATQRYLIKSVLVAEHEVREPISVLLLTAGLWIFLDNLFLLAFGPDYRAIRSPMGRLNWIFFNELVVNVPRFVAFLTSSISAIVVHLFFKYHELGRLMRATGQDRKMAALLGIDIYNMYNIAFGISCALVGLCGTLLSVFYYINPSVGSIFDIRAFIIVVLGGLGSIPGAMLGGIIIGLIESVGAQFISATLTEGMIYLLFLLILFYKPAGLFGLKGEW